MGSAISVARCEEDSPDVEMLSGDDLQAGSAAEEVAAFEEPVAAAEPAEAAEEVAADEDDADEEEKPEVIEVATVPYDSRFPSTNQARNCYTRYNEYYKCIQDKDPESPDCKFYQKAYRSLCPSEWVLKWNEAREDGTWFGRY